MASNQAPRLPDPRGSSGLRGNAGTSSRETAIDVADRCRGLLLSLVNGTGRSRDRRDVLVWLARYHDLAVWVEGPPRPVDAHRRRSPIDRAHVSEWILDATSKVGVGVQTLRDPWRGRGFALDATLDEWIVPFTDVLGRRGWRPTDRRYRSLAERALALLAADYLVRPQDYERALQQCGACRRIWFEDRASTFRGGGSCCRTKAPRAKTSATWRSGATSPVMEQTA